MNWLAIQGAATVVAIAAVIICAAWYFLAEGLPEIVIRWRRAAAIRRVKAAFWNACERDIRTAQLQVNTINHEKQLAREVANVARLHYERERRTRIVQRRPGEYELERAP